MMTKTNSIVAIFPAGLYILRLPKDSILQSELALKTGKFFLIAHGSENGITRAKKASAAPRRRHCNIINRPGSN